MKVKSFSVTLANEAGEAVTIIENNVYDVVTVLTKYKDAIISSTRKSLTFTQYDACGRRLGFIDENDMGFWIYITDIISVKESEENG